MESIRKRLERNQQVITEQRRIDRQFVIKSRRTARNWNEYLSMRFGDLYTHLSTGKDDVYECRAISGRDSHRVKNRFGGRPTAKGGRIMRD